jgi:hypothetical protein
VYEHPPSRSQLTSTPPAPCLLYAGIISERIQAVYVNE